jgi:hypothetical protein
MNALSVAMYSRICLPQGCATSLCNLRIRKPIWYALSVVWRGGWATAGSGDSKQDGEESTQFA